MENVCRSENADQSRQSQPAQHHRKVNQIDAEESSQEEGDSQEEVEFIICKEDDCQPILGFTVSQQMRLLTMQEQNFERVASVRVDEFPEVFDRQLGKLAGKQTLCLKEGSQPVVLASR